MEITSVKVKKFNVTDTSNLLGVATAVIDKCFIITDLKIIQGKERLFLAMPSQKMPDGCYKDIVHPLTAECRQMFEEAVLKEFNSINDTNS